MRHADYPAADAGVADPRPEIPLNDYAGANVTGDPTVPLLCGCPSLTLLCSPTKQKAQTLLCFTELDAEHPVLPQQQSMKPDGGRRVLSAPRRGDL